MLHCDKMMKIEKLYQSVMTCSVNVKAKMKLLHNAYIDYIVEMEKALKAKNDIIKGQYKLIDELEIKK